MAAQMSLALDWREEFQQLQQQIQVVKKQMDALEVTFNDGVVCRLVAGFEFISKSHRMVWVFADLVKTDAGISVKYYAHDQTRKSYPCRVVPTLKAEVEELVELYVGSDDDEVRLTATVDTEFRCGKVSFAGKPGRSARTVEFTEVKLRKR